MHTIDQHGLLQVNNNISYDSTKTHWLTPFLCISALSHAVSLCGKFQNVFFVSIRPHCCCSTEKTYYEINANRTVCFNCCFIGKADPPPPPRLHAHPDTPFTFEALTKQVISFEKAKLTNNEMDRNGQVSRHLATIFICSIRCLFTTSWCEDNFGKNFPLSNTLNNSTNTPLFDCVWFEMEKMEKILRRRITYFVLCHMFSMRIFRHFASVYT